MGVPAGSRRLLLGTSSALERLAEAQGWWEKPFRRKPRLGVQSQRLFVVSSVQTPVPVGESQTWKRPSEVICSELPAASGAVCKQGNRSSANLFLVPPSRDHFRREPGHAAARSPA